VIVPKKVVAKISASRVDELIAQIGPEFFRNIDSLLTFIGVELEELLEMRSQFRRKNGGEDPAVLKIPKVHVMGSEVVFAPINRPMFDSKND
jgi:hypothetical protein